MGNIFGSGNVSSRSNTDLQNQNNPQQQEEDARSISSSIPHSRYIYRSTSNSNQTICDTLANQFLYPNSSSNIGNTHLSQQISADAVRPYVVRPSSSHTSAHNNLPLAASVSTNVPSVQVTAQPLVDLVPAVTLNQPPQVNHIQNDIIFNETGFECLSQSAMRRSLPTFSASSFVSFTVALPIGGFINAVYFGKLTSIVPWQNVLNDLQMQLSILIQNCRVVEGISMVGFDTESEKRNIQLYQISSLTHAVIIHKTSGLFESSILKRFFENNFKNKSHTLIFAGAEMSLEALDVPLHGILDLTPIYSSLISKKLNKFTITDTNQLQPCKETDRSFSLNNIFNLLVTGSLNEHIWVKDIAITCSEWSNGDLTERQLNYAVLDAYASCYVGTHAITYLRQRGVLKQVFTSVELHRAAEHKSLLQCLQKMAFECDGLGDLEKVEKAVKIGNLTTDSKNPNVGLQVLSGEYANHLRMFAAVKIKIISPQGSKDGVLFDATVNEVKGKISCLMLSPLSPLSPEALNNEADRYMYRSLQSNAIQKIIRIFQDEYNEIGPYRNHHLSRQEKISKQKRLVQVRIIFVDAGSSLLRQVSWTIRQFMQAKVVPHSFFPSSTTLHSSLLTPIISPSYRLIAKSQHLDQYLYGILTQSHFENKLPSYLMTQTLQSSIEFYNQSLNARQYESLKLAVMNKFSIISGPPGTGKTRTISAICDIMTEANKRILILAPANSASRRVLESIVGQDFRNACLIVSNEYFYEWHEGSYDDSIGQYVHTKEHMDDNSGGSNHRYGNNHHNQQHSQNSSSNNSNNLSQTQTSRSNDPYLVENRVHHDFRPRVSKEHTSIWTDLAKHGSSRDRPLPSVVIGTYGCLANCISGNKRSGWSEEVNNILHLDSIDMIIIDETSQLWDGFALGLLARCSKVTNIVFVGDDKQLAPYGNNDINGLRSLFSCALKYRCNSNSIINNQTIPHSLLNQTYRLTPMVASIISSQIYNGELRVNRFPESDIAFLIKFKDITSSLRDCVTKDLLTHYFQGLTNDINTCSSLAWIHHDCEFYTNTETKSSGNEGEAKIVTDTTAKLIQIIHLDHERARQQQLSHPNRSYHLAERHRTKVVILTPYLEQKTVLEKSLAKSMEGFQGMSQSDLVDWISSALIVNTIDSFQGQEAEFVLISLTKTGFTDDPRRANVMLSRASQLLVVVGNSHEFVKNENPQTTQSLIVKMACVTSEKGAMFGISNNRLFRKQIPISLLRVRNSVATGLNRAATVTSNATLTSNSSSSISLNNMTSITDTETDINTIHSSTQNREAFTTLSAQNIELLKVIQKHLIHRSGGNSLLLSLLGTYLTQAERSLLPSHNSSLLANIRTLPGLIFHQAPNNDWYVTLDKNFNTLFFEAVNDVIDSSRNKKVSMSDLGATIPRICRPVEVLIENFRENTDYKITVNNNNNEHFIERSSATAEVINRIFVEKMKNLIINKGGRVELLIIGKFVKKEQRPHKSLLLSIEQFPDIFCIENSCILPNGKHAKHVVSLKSLNLTPHNQFIQRVHDAIADYGGEIIVSQLGDLIPVAQRPFRSPLTATLREMDDHFVVFYDEGYRMDMVMSRVSE